MNYLEAGIKLLETIESLGYEAYFVGGFVRDYLIDGSYHDIDVTTSATPDKLMPHFKYKNTGLKYNSITILFEGYEFETTTYRLDVKSVDHRHPEFKVAKTLEEDLVRRDFTVNAMAMNSKLEVVDLFGGKSDLENHILKTVGDPLMRFSEDALRMLRLAYFTSKTGFKVEKETKTAMKKSVALLDTLSKDRIMWELMKLMDSKYPYKGVKLLVETNAIEYIAPYDKGVQYIYDNKIKKIDWLYFACINFYEDIPLLHKTSIQNAYKANIERIIEASKKLKEGVPYSHIVIETNIDSLLFASELNHIMFGDDNNLKQIKDIVMSMPIVNKNELDIKASEIIELLALEDFDLLKQIQQEILYLVVDGKLSNNNLIIKQYLLAHYKKI